MTYLVHGATGAQGGPVLDALVAGGRPAVALSRRPRADGRGGSVRVADYDSVEQLTSAYRAVDGVFVHLPLGAEADRLRYARTILAALDRARPGRVVISTSGRIVDDPGSPLHEPGGSALRTLIAGVQDLGMSSAVVAPRLFLENLLQPAVWDPVEGEGMLRYPLPAAFGVSWSSHLDNADAVVALLDRTDVTGVVAVGQYPAINGPGLAAAFAEHVGRPVLYEAITPREFGDYLAPHLGASAAAGVVRIYDAVQSHTGNVISPDRSAQRLLGITPRTTRQWLAALHSPAAPRQARAW